MIAIEGWKTLRTTLVKKTYLDAGSLFLSIVLVAGSIMGIFAEKYISGAFFAVLGYLSCVRFISKISTTEENDNRNNDTQEEKNRD